MVKSVVTATEERKKKPGRRTVDGATADLKNANVRLKDTVTKEKTFFPMTRGLPFKGDVDAKYYKKLREQFLTNYELVKPHSPKEGVV